MRWRNGIFAASLGALAGCYTPEPISLDSDAAPRAIPAIKQAAEKDDVHSIPRLVRDLDDTDVAIRFAAITALRRMTGQTLGYRYYDDVYARRDAVQRWQKWLREKQEQSAVSLGVKQ